MNVNFDGRTYSFEVWPGSVVEAGLGGQGHMPYEILPVHSSLRVQLSSTEPDFCTFCFCGFTPSASACLPPQVKPGPDGYRQFTEAIRRAFNLPDDSELNITFTCDEPVTSGAGVVGPPGVAVPGQRSLVSSLCACVSLPPPACLSCMPACVRQEDSQGQPLPLPSYLLL
jgi:hypothetical protein